MKKASIEQRENNEEQSFIFKGEFTRETNLDYAGHIIPYLNKNKKILFDMSEVTRADTVFLANVVYILRNLYDFDICLSNLSPQIKSLIEISQLEKILKISEENQTRIINAAA